MGTTTQPRYTIEQLMEATGVSRRTIRYYIAEKLLAPPAGRGNGAFYYDSHLARLQAILAQQRAGLSLAAIAGQAAPESAPASSSAAPAPRQACAEYQLAPGVTLRLALEQEQRLKERLPELLYRLQQELARLAEPKP